MSLFIYKGTEIDVDYNVLIKVPSVGGWPVSEEGVIQTDSPLSVSELLSAVAFIIATHNSQAYSRSRKSAYDLLNQDELRYDDLVNGTTAWPDAIAAIKLEFPK